MLTARMKIQVLAFVIIALVATTYLSARYVGLDPFKSSYNVTVALPQAGGIFENGEVTYRGVPVGRIESLKVTDDGMEATLRINKDAPDIPADVKVQVSNRSAIGEQYINLSSETTDGPKLESGDRIVGTDASLPPSIDELLRTGYEFVNSVPKDALTTVIDETYNFSKGANRNLPRLVQTSKDFAESADRNFLVTKGLIENSTIVLKTQEESAASIKAFSRNLRLIAGGLKDADKPLRDLIGATPAASQEIGKLFNEVGGPIGALMANLVSTAQIFGVNASGVEDALIRMPEAFSVGYAITKSSGMEMGLVQTYFDPLPCTTGYGDTTVRPGLDTSGGKKFNTNAGCTLAPSSGANVRGPTSVRVPSTLAELMGE
ncbi:MlaD family protein [Nocardioides sp. Soil796]|uniref:MlaD family protein n=1 Tax=Nocardioides sp. Soil796 TaxID=1736412 RepID=UPI00070CF1EF|nr:MlaD family protein [Nocardioides sp. Soil796]KRF14504.1 hypothetical protein ASH02_09255 [Nocardioides sp. Soil796]